MLSPLHTLGRVTSGHSATAGGDNVEVHKQPSLVHAKGRVDFRELTLLKVSYLFRHKGNRPVHGRVLIGGPWAVAHGPPMGDAHGPPMWAGAHGTPVSSVYGSLTGVL